MGDFFPTVLLTEAEGAAAEFRFRAQKATEMGFAAAFPNFYTAPYGSDGMVGGTILIRAPGAQWRDVPLTELGSPPLEDFGARMRATQDYAGREGFVGGFPNFFHADYGNGIVCGTVLLTAEVAEWRDVPLEALPHSALNQIEQRFRDTQDYAVSNGFVGGFPNMYHAEVLRAQRRGVHHVCGTILLRAPLAEWQDVVIRDPLH